MKNIDWSKETDTYFYNLRNYIVEGIEKDGVAPSFKDTLKFVVNDVLIKYKHINVDDVNEEFMKSFVPTCKNKYDYYVANYKKYSIKERNKNQIERTYKNLSNFVGFRLSEMGFTKEEIDKKVEELGLNVRVNYYFVKLDDDFLKDCADITDGCYIKDPELSSIIQKVIPEELYFRYSIRFTPSIKGIFK